MSDVSQELMKQTIEAISKGITKELDRWVFAVLTETYPEKMARVQNRNDLRNLQQFLQDEGIKLRYENPEWNDDLDTLTREYKIMYEDAEEPIETLTVNIKTGARVV